MKQSIVDYLNHQLDETFEVIDIFKTTAETNGMLTYCGYRHLKAYYEFHEIEVKFSDNVLNNVVLFGKIKGLYFVTSTKDQKVKRIYATDRGLLNRLKLYNNDFNKYVERTYEKKS